MTIRLYLDEDSMHRGLVRALRARGVDVITALDVGMIEREDTEHLGYAAEQGRVLCTFNAGDFYRLHSDLSVPGQATRRDYPDAAATFFGWRADASPPPVDCEQVCR